MMKVYSTRNMDQAAMANLRTEIGILQALSGLVSIVSPFDILEVDNMVYLIFEDNT